MGEFVEVTLLLEACERPEPLWRNGEELGRGEETAPLTPGSKCDRDFIDSSGDIKRGSLELLMVSP